MLMMTKENIERVLNSSSWDFIGEGTYSRVSRSRKQLTINGQTCHWVIKESIRRDRLAAPERVVRKWNEINPEHPAFVTMYGWIAPYMGSTGATDEQIAVKVIEIYQRTGNIIADACAPKNFLYSNEAVYCVDFDFAFKRLSIETEDFSFFKQTIYQGYFDNWESTGCPVSVAVIQSLGYLDTLPSSSSEIITTEIIGKRFLTVRVLEIIANYRMCKRGLVELIRHLPILARIEQLDPDKRIPNRFLVPSFIADIADGIDESTTFELLEEWLATHMILAPRLNNPKELPSVLELYGCTSEERPIHLIEKQDVDGIRLLFKYDRDAIHQRYKGLTWLHHAATKGKSISLRVLIDLGSDIYARTEPASLAEDNEQHSALELAIKSEHGQTAKILLEEGYQSEERISELLKIIKKEQLIKLFTMAAQENMLELLKRLFQIKPKLIHYMDFSCRTALIHAAMRGHLCIVDYLIKQNANVNWKTRFLPSEKGSEFLNEFTLADWALYYGHKNVFDYFSPEHSIIIENHFLRPENLFDALRNDDLAKIKWLLPHGSPLLKQIFDETGTALHLAIIRKQYAIADYLIQAGSDLTISSTWHATPRFANAWFTALHHRATEVIRACLEHAIDQLIRTFSDTAIMQAATLGLLEPVKRLVASDCQLLNLTDPYNRTPLSLAVVHGHIDLARFLIESGARLDIPLRMLSGRYHPETPFNGLCTLNLARKLGNPEMISLLEGAVAPPSKTVAYTDSPSLFFAGSAQASSSNGLVLDVTPVGENQTHTVSHPLCTS